ncbi:hypothetical protein A0257_14145 [Hymenobacter psoromatis]|nr:hypothetical protein A0257_14145 [Hymenobacter psoromatis]
MRSDRHILRREWEDVRADIERVIREENLLPSEFRPLGIHEDWKAIEEKIYHSFCQLHDPIARPTWLWAHFKQPHYAVLVDYPDGFQLLLKLVEPAETVWLFLEGENNKFWFYEGKIEAIVKVLEENMYVQEQYIVSKKYEWLLCITHHDVLYAAGNTMPDRLRQLKES